MRNPAGLWGGRAAHTPLLEEIKKLEKGEGGINMMQPFHLIIKKNSTKFTQKVSLLVTRTKLV